MKDKNANKAEIEKIKQSVKKAGSEIIKHPAVQKAVTDAVLGLAAIAYRKVRNIFKKRGSE